MKVLLSITPRLHNRLSLSKKRSSNCTHPIEREASWSSSNRSLPSNKRSEELTLLQLKEFCHLFHIRMTEVQIFRYACCHEFDYDRARKAIETSYDSPYLHLRRMSGPLVDQFQKQVIFPLPRLRSKEDSQVIYIHASRLHLQENTTSGSTNSRQQLIDSLYYLLNDMSRTRQDCQKGVCVMINLKDYNNDSQEDDDDMDAILQAIKPQGKLLVPTRITALLFIDAPKTFTTTWEDLRLFPKKVHFIKSSDNKLGDFLMDGYRDYLPTDMGGWKHSSEIVEDYVDQKIYQELSL